MLDWNELLDYQNAGDYKKYVSKPSFVSQETFNKNFVTIHEIKPVLTLNKPIHVGFSIPGLVFPENMMLIYYLQTRTV